jgi:predicted Fe-Mo cluster-binding NifX family protein
MKMCISSTANNLDAQLDPRFGRCNCLLIIDTETLQYQVIPNQAADATGGAGVQAAQIIANSNATLVVTGNIGPNAYKALSAAGITVMTGASGTIKEVLEALKTGSLKKAGAPTVEGHFGTQTIQGPQP